MACVSCSENKQETEIAETLRLAGDNASELQKALDYYKEPRDSLRHKAVQFLVSNMKYHQAYYGKEKDRYAGIFKYIDSLYYEYSDVSDEQKDEAVRQFILTNGAPDFKDIKIINDAQYLTASYLINTVEFAFKIWESVPWAKRITFDDFCEYLLPYRIMQEKVQYWRGIFFNNAVLDALTHATYPSPEIADSAFQHTYGFLTSGNTLFKSYYPFDQSVGDIIAARMGECEALAFIRTSAMRATGLPATVDYVPQWGNYVNRHYWPALVSHKQKKSRITNQNKPVDTWNIIAFSTEFNESMHAFTKEELPEGVYIQYAKTVPKVYRYTFSLNKELFDLSSGKEDVDPGFKNFTVKDVTDEYVETADVNVAIEDKNFHNRIVYLSVFDQGGWKAVAITRAQGASAKFTKIGKNIVYLPTAYQYNSHIPVGKPFMIDSSGNYKTFDTKNNKINKIRLLRKAPLFPYTTDHVEILKGGRFEGANSSDFKDAELLANIDRYPFYMNAYVVKNKKKYRYLRYVAPQGNFKEADNIAEVQFFGKEVAPLKGDVIGLEGTIAHPIDAAFDGDLNTYYENAAFRDGWIGIDLGPDRSQNITHIRFCPRNDTNCILPGLQYELFYWDDKWVSLGAQEAVDYFLEYKHVPDHGLYRLHCSEGKEERIFTIEDGIQKWW